MPKIRVGDVEINYEIQGEGEPLVLIPGFRTGLWLWFKQLKAFYEKFRTIVFDPRGIGESDRVNAPITIRTIADDLAGMLSVLGTTVEAFLLASVHSPVGTQL
jgi:3-oxoadipate enol-lactonase